MKNISESQATVASCVKQYEDVVGERLKNDFTMVGVEYPPKRIVFIGLKKEKLLEVWVSGDGQGYSFLKTYHVLGASGRIGPKLQRGDLQVPEGIYKIESLNPNSRYHLSLRVNYPNDFDKTMANCDGRDDLGGDIMIHGSTVSAGCLAMGDPASEDLFILAALVGVENIEVILSPVDFRKGDYEIDFSKLPSWSPQLYEQIKNELARYSTDIKR